MPGDRRSDLQRSEQGQIHPYQRQGSPDHSRFGRDRRPDPQHHLDAVAPDRRHVLHGDQLLRRARVHGAQEARRRFGAQARRRVDLRPTGDDDRAQSLRLFPRQRHQVRAGGFRNRRGSDQGLRFRPLRRLHDRCFGPLFRASQDGQPGRPYGAAGNHLQGTARPLGAQGRRRMVPDRAMDPLCARHRRGDWA